MLSFFQSLGAIQIGLSISLMVLGVYLSFRILNFPDLTVDGSFPLGGGIIAVMVMHGYSPFIGLCVAGVGGFIAGFLTAWLHVRWKIMHLLAGILTMTALYSINLRIMGSPNISLYGQSSIFSSFSFFNLSPLYVILLSLGGITFLFLFLIYRLLISQAGVALRAVGNNPIMARAQGIDDKKYILLGLGVSNMLVAMGGAIWVQAYGVADVNMGIGKVIEGLAAVILGEAIIKSRSIFWSLVACILGAILYRFIIAFALNIEEIGLASSDLNFVTAFIVALAMILPQIRYKLKIARVKKSQ